MTRQRYKPDALYFVFSDFDQSGSPATAVNLSPNTILLAYKLVQYHGLNRDRFIQSENSVDDYVESISDAEFFILQDWYEQALVELKTPLSSILVFPILGTIPSPKLDVGDSIDIATVDDPDCDGWAVRVTFATIDNHPIDTDLTINITNWFRPVAACGGYSLDAYDSQGNNVLTLDRYDTPDNTVLTCSDVVIKSRNSGVVTITRNS